MSPCGSDSSRCIYINNICKGCGRKFNGNKTHLAELEKQLESRIKAEQVAKEKRQAAEDKLSKRDEYIGHLEQKKADYAVRIAELEAEVADLKDLLREITLGDRADE